MPIHLQREIEKLKQQIVLLGGVVEKSVEDAVRSVEQRMPELARQVIDSDSKIDQWEIDVEEEGLKILALHQPVAIDLRFIIAVLKINSDLERIGDEAVNISERSLKINAAPRPRMDFDITGSSKRVQKMLKKSIDSLVNMDAAAARNVRDSDDEVDNSIRQTFEQVKQEIRQNPALTDVLVEYMRILRHLERIGDHATNIAEDVIYMTEGTIVRHHHEK